MKIRELLIQSLIIALVALGTIGIQIAFVGINGFFNFGDLIIMGFAIILQKKRFALGAGLGSMIADLLTPWAMYAPFTFVIKSLEFLVVVIIYNALSNRFAKQTLPVIIGASVMALGYAFTESSLYGWAYFWPALGLNALQSMLSALIVIIIYPFLWHIRKVYPKI